MGCSGTVEPLTFTEVRKVWYVPLHAHLFSRIYDLNNPRNSSNKLLFFLFPDLNPWVKTSSSAFCKSPTFLQIFYYRCKHIIRVLLRWDLQEFYLILRTSGWNKLYQAILGFVAEHWALFNTLSNCLLFFSVSVLGSLVREATHKKKLNMNALKKN